MQITLILWEENGYVGPGKVITLLNSTSLEKKKIVHTERHARGSNEPYN